MIFVNDKELMHFSYVRYLENKIRDTFGFQNLKFIIRERQERRVVCGFESAVWPSVISSGLFQTSYIYRSHSIDVILRRQHIYNMMRTLIQAHASPAGDCVKCMLAVGLVCLLFGKSHGEMLPLSRCMRRRERSWDTISLYLSFGGKGIAATAGLVLIADPIMSSFRYYYLFQHLFYHPLCVLGLLLVFTPGS